VAKAERQKIVTEMATKLSTAAGGDTNFKPFFGMTLAYSLAQTGLEALGAEPDPRVVEFERGYGRLEA
jgi:hypothetical protein